MLNLAFRPDQSIQEGFILDIDVIQNHGTLGWKIYEPSVYAFDCIIDLTYELYFMTGIGVADITKLKANGYYTINVSETCARTEIFHEKYHVEP